MTIKIAPIAPPATDAPWTGDDLTRLRVLVGLELPMRVIARKLNRPEQAVRRKAQNVALTEMRRPVASVTSWPVGH